MKKQLLIILGMILFVSISEAQQLPVITQFQYNRLFYNPAYAGSNEQFSASTLFRKQWIGDAGIKSPTTGLFSADAPIGTSKLGLGGYAIYDHTGVTSNTEISGAISYKLNITSESYLSGGIKAGASFYKSDLNQVRVWDPGDEVFEGRTISQTMPRVGFGAYYYSTNYYVGLSAPDIITYDKNKLFVNDDGTSRTVFRNYVLMGGMNINLTNRFVLIPSAVVKYYPNTPLFVNVNAGLKFSEKLLAGIGYRTPSTFSLFGQLAVNEKVKVGYAFDYSPSKFQLGKLGSHELMVSYGLQQ